MLSQVVPPRRARQGNKIDSSSSTDGSVYSPNSSVDSSTHVRAKKVRTPRATKKTSCASAAGAKAAPLQKVVKESTKRPPKSRKRVTQYKPLVTQSPGKRARVSTPKKGEVAPNTNKKQASPPSRYKELVVSRTPQRTRRQNPAPFVPPSRCGSEPPVFDLDGSSTAIDLTSTTSSPVEALDGKVLSVSDSRANPPRSPNEDTSAKLLSPKGNLKSPSTEEDELSSIGRYHPS